MKRVIAVAVRTFNEQNTVAVISAKKNKTVIGARSLRQGIRTAVGKWEKHPAFPFQREYCPEIVDLVACLDDKHLRRFLGEEGVKDLEIRVIHTEFEWDFDELLTSPRKELR